MSKLLSGNGMWESSRMMLPQHKERIKSDLKKEKIKRRPVLHEDEWEDILRNIAEYAHSKEQVVVTIFGEYENQTIEGWISEVSEQRKAIRVKSDEDNQWIPIAEIVSVVKR